jgi:hypothetical protein
MVRAQGIVITDPASIIDDVLSNKISSKDGLSALFDQTGLTQTSFQQKYHYAPSAVASWVRQGFFTSTDTAKELANELGREDLTELIRKTFCRKKAAELSGVEEALEERTHFHQSYAVQSHIDWLQKTNSEPSNSR